MLLTSISDESNIFKMKENLINDKNKLFGLRLSRLLDTNAPIEIGPDDIKLFSLHQSTCQVLRRDGLQATPSGLISVEKK